MHTNDIGAAIEAALDLDGRPRQIRVTDLFEEVAAEHAVREAAIDGRPPSELPAVTCAVVAVSSGPGISELFGELGVQGVVTGGQTLNPSTAELLDAVERVNADQVVVLPGNKNIIPVAEQLDALTTKTVRVVPTRSMPEGLAALMVVRPRGDAPRSTRPRCATPPRRSPPARSRRRCGPARRDAGPVAEGDWMGSSAATASSPSHPTSLGGGDRAARPPRRRRPRAGHRDHRRRRRRGRRPPRSTAWLADHRPGVEVEVHDGGQPLYPYLFGVE